ncbi:MAG: vitamin B12-dependent ribonucleotide reductase [bacterium]|nr:vitamin B12-dependent ribonucleotide reductase [bacterium]
MHGQAEVLSSSSFLFTIKSIRKRDGRLEDFQPEKLRAALVKTFADAGMDDTSALAHSVQHIITRLQARFDGHTIPDADAVRETIGLTLIDENLAHVAKKYLEFRSRLTAAERKPVYGRGISFSRFFTMPGVHPYDEIEWEKRDASITNGEGKVVFEQKGVEMPKFYSQTATNIVVSKYFRGRLNTPERESSARQMVDRVARTIATWGRHGAYFATEQDAISFEEELTSILINQRASFNSPVWFNVGVNPHPQCSACFINSVQDDMRSILHLAVTEGMLFKYGSGSGVNLSSLRSSREHLSQSSGKSSGPVSFMKGLDAFAGVIKSGGKTRRAAKMVVLDVTHPDVLDFVWCKAKEEKKAHTLIDAGYDSSLDGEAYGSIFFQNANNSVRVNDDFMKAVEADGEWVTRAVTTGQPCDRYRAREVMRQIAQAAWECGDPGMQYDTTINDWHTCSNTDRIFASNPCSEYMFLNDSACNLASVNLMRCRRPNGSFDVAAFEYICRVMATAQEILVGFSSYPTPAIEQNSFDYRPLGLGYANLGSLLMSMGLAYDSDEGRSIAAAITSVMSAAGYEQSAKIAEKLGAFAGFEKNRETMLRVMQKHREAAYRVVDDKIVPADLAMEAKAAWDRTVALGERVGYRNAQISVLAPTGTISFMMDCATTGIEPDIALVKYKWLVGGGMLKIVNDTVPAALEKLGYAQTEINDILKFIDENDTIEGSPKFKAEHLSVFDCAFKPAKGSRSIHYRGHIKMMSAVQPFISGAISKTVNMPERATVEEIMEVYQEAWKLGLKAVAIYRDGCKRAQPLTLTKNDGKKKEAVAVAPTATGESYAPRRRRLTDERRAITHKFQIGSHEGYFTVGLYDDGTPGEIFITMSKQGSVIRGLMDAFATSISIGLQYGVPIKVLVNKFAHMRFEPSGFTQNPNIRLAKSIVDYIFRWLALKFLLPEERHSLGINVEGATTPLTTDTDPGALNGHGPSLFASAPVQEDKRQTKLIDENGSALSKLTSSFDNQSDAPPCETCGAMMVRNAACYKCLNCGATSGCS